MRVQVVILNAKITKKFKSANQCWAGLGGGTKNKKVIEQVGHIETDSQISHLNTLGRTREEKLLKVVYENFLQYLKGWMPRGLALFYVTPKPDWSSGHRLSLGRTARPT